MYILIVIFTIIFFTLSFSCILASIYFHKKEKELLKNYVGIVKTYNFIWLVGFIGGLFFLAITILAWTQDVHWFTIGGFLLFVWLCNCLMYSWLGTIILYEQNGFYIGILPLQRQYYLYEELTAQRKSSKVMIFYIGKRTISMEYMVSNCKEFESYAWKKYKSKQGRELPIIKTVPKWDVFNGNIESPESIMIIYGILLLMVVGVFGYTLYDAHIVIEKEDTVLIEDTVKMHYIEENSLFLDLNHSEGTYEIRGMNLWKEQQKLLLEKIEKEETFSLYVKAIGEEHEKSFLVYQIEDSEGTVYVSFSISNQWNKENGYQIAFIMFVFVVMIVIFIVGSIIVGRNPKKFSKRVRNFFFKEQAWRVK